MHDLAVREGVLDTLIRDDRSGHDLVVTDH